MKVTDILDIVRWSTPHVLALYTLLGEDKPATIKALQAALVAARAKTDADLRKKHRR